MSDIFLASENWRWTQPYLTNISKPTTVAQPSNNKENIFQNNEWVPLIDNYVRHILFELTRTWLSATYQNK